MDIEKIRVMIKTTGKRTVTWGFNYNNSIVVTSSNLFAIASLIGKTGHLQNMDKALPNYLKNNNGNYEVDEVFRFGYMR